MQTFVITSDDPAGPTAVRHWAFQRRLLIDKGKLPNTVDEWTRIDQARALAAEWDGTPPPPPTHRVHSVRAEAGRPSWWKRVFGKGQ